MCGKVQTSREFDVHHIDYDMKNCNQTNLITLCPTCHKRTNPRQEEWIATLALINNFDLDVTAKAELLECHK